MDEKLQKYINNGNYELALNYINKILNKNYSFEYHNYKIIIFILNRRFDAALIELSQLNLKYPNDSTILCNFGLAYKGKKLYLDAIDCFNRSIKIDPSNINTYLNLIETYIENFNFKDAIDILNNLVDRHSNTERFHQLLSFCYREINCFDKAKNHLEITTKINPSNYENFYHLGFSYIWEKNYHDAIKCFKRSYELNKKYIPAIYQLNNILKFDYDSPFYNILINLYDKEIDTNNLAYKYLTLSEIHYRKNDYYNFFKYLHKANKLKNLNNKGAKIDPNIIQKIYSKIPNLNIENTEFTPVFILGMPRSGSSVFEQIISQSKDVYAAGEISLLHEQFNQLISFNPMEFNSSSLITIRKNYLNYLSMLPSKKFIVDKLPLNFFWIGFIKTILPNSIFIHTIRNKIDICMSLYKNFFADNTLEFSYNLKNINNFYSTYNNMMSYWRSQGFDIIEFDYDKFISNPKNQIQSIFNKLNFEYNDSYLDLLNINRPVKTASFLQINNKIEKFNYPDWGQFSDEISILLTD